MENINQLKNQLKDDARKAVQAVAEFGKEEMGIDEEEPDLFDMYDQIENFISKLKEQNPTKAAELTKKYEELKAKADEAFENIAKHADELYS